MSDTRMKLEEAAFFLHALQDNVMIAPYNGFALSAFLSAARSVTFIMQKEFAHADGFGAWWQEQSAKLQDFKSFNDLRVLVVHQGVPKLRTFLIGGSFSCVPSSGFHNRRGV